MRVLLPRRKRGTARTEALFSISVVGMIVGVLGGILLTGRAASSSSAPPPPPRRELVICADPDGLPFSNDRLEGYENRLARLVTQEIGVTAHFTFWPDRRTFFKNTLVAGHCDLVMGIPTDFEGVFTTRPYLRAPGGPVSMAVRSKEWALGEALDEALTRRRADIDALLDEAGVLPMEAEDPLE